MFVFFVHTIIRRDVSAPLTMLGVISIFGVVASYHAKMSLNRQGTMNHKVLSTTFAGWKVTSTGTDINHISCLCVYKVVPYLIHLGAILQTG
jgi:hypothetical protein